VGEWTYMTSKN